VYVEVGDQLRQMVNDRGEAEQGRRTSDILQVPEEEREDEADAESHEPKNEHHRRILYWREHSDHSQPLRQVAGLPRSAPWHVRRRLGSGHRRIRPIDACRIRDHVSGTLLVLEGDADFLTVLILDELISVVRSQFQTDSSGTDGSPRRSAELLLDSIDDAVLEFGQLDCLERRVCLDETRVQVTIYMELSVRSACDMTLIYIIYI